LKHSQHSRHAEAGPDFPGPARRKHLTTDPQNESVKIDTLDRSAPIRIFHNICIPAELLLSSLQQSVISGMSIRDDCQGWHFKEVLLRHPEQNILVNLGWGEEDTGGGAGYPNAGVVSAGSQELAVTNALRSRLAVLS
jgi:hypothetical protein